MNHICAAYGPYVLSNGPTATLPPYPAIRSCLKCARNPRARRLSKMLIARFTNFNGWVR
jgi:hypothetical protein